MHELDASIMHGYFKLMLWFLKLALPVMVVTGLVIPFYGLATPWQPAQTVLAHYAGQRPILVGASSDSKGTGQNIVESSQRSYILFPSLFYDPKVIFITDDNGRVQVYESGPGAFFFFFLTYAACVFFSYRLWCKKKTAATT